MFVRRRSGIVTSLLLLTAASVLTLVFTASPAGAHGDEGKMTVIAATSPAPAAVHLEVGIVYGNDDDLAEEASATATLTGPGGATVGPVALPRISGGRYGADVPVPTAGSWAAAIRSENPEATANATVDVAASSSPGTPPSTSASGTPTTARTPTTAAPTTAPPTSVAASTTSASSSNTPLIIGAVVLVVLLGIGTALVLRARGGTAGDGDPTSP